MRAPVEKIVVGAVLRSNDKRTLGKEVTIVEIRHTPMNGISAGYQAGKRTAFVNQNDIYVEGHSIARGWQLVGSAVQ